MSFIEMVILGVLSATDDRSKDEPDPISDSGDISLLDIVVISIVTVVTVLLGGGLLLSSMIS